MTTKKGPESSLMFQEAKQAASIVREQLIANKTLIQDAVSKINSYEPRSIVTMARGSSDHAATYLKYLSETRLGLVCASAAPSISSLYLAKQKLAGTLYIAISQSGASPDLLASVERANESGALTLAFVNVEDSPLAKLADIVIPLRAGKEQSVAATKSYIATLSAVAQLVAALSESEILSSALTDLPAQLEEAWDCDWTTKGLATFATVNNMFVIGRGMGFGVAQEAALKFKETCAVHAEAFSAAEVKHGPMAIIGKAFPLLVIGQEDETRESMDELVEEYLGRGAKVLYAAESASGAHALPVVKNTHPALAPILAVQSFYRMANAISFARGLNPDEPPHLNKVTETL